MARADKDWQVYDLDAVEDGLCTILNGFDVKAYGKRSTEERETPCVELALETQAVQGQRFIRWPTINSAVAQPFNTWNFTLLAKVISERISNGLDHRRIIGSVRAYFQYAWLATTFTRTVSPYHAITDIREEGAPNEIREEDNLDVTELTFIGMLNIRDDAWPLTMS